MTLKEKQHLKSILNISILSIIVNICLSIFKMVAGWLGHSKALISDAIHSLSDVLTTIIVMIGAVIAKKDADKDHPYGHEKFESIASLILGMILFFTAILLFYQGVSTLISFFGGTIDIKTPTRLALLAALISIVLKEAMFWVTRYIAKKVNSTALMADAWHQRSDALSSVGSLIGVLFAMLGFLYFDALAAVFISLLIFSVAFKVILKAINQVVDKTPNKDVLLAIESCIMNQKGVLNVDLLHVRMHAEKLFVDVEIAVNASLTLVEAHQIAEVVHDEIEKQFADVKHCMVHVNPYKKKSHET